MVGDAPINGWIKIVMLWLSSRYVFTCCLCNSVRSLLCFFLLPYFSAAGAAATFALCCCLTLSLLFLPILLPTMYCCQLLFTPHALSPALQAQIQP